MAAPVGVSAGHSPMITTDVPVPILVGQSVVVEPDAVRILDRRVLPFQRRWVTCRSHEDVARAIEDMVTQSLGPLFAAAGGMTLAARDADRLPTARAHPADEQRHPGRRRRAAGGRDGCRGRRGTAGARRRAGRPGRRRAVPGRPPAPG